MAANLPNTKSTYYSNMVNKWKRVETILGGEEAIKAAGEMYLPKLSGQTPEEYTSYKERGSFFNAFNRTLEGLSGAIMRKEPTIVVNQTVDKLIKKRVTLSGESIQEVAKIAIQSIIAYGYFGILVDMPPVPEGAVVNDNNPYMALYNASSILNFETTQVGDENKLIMLALAEIDFKRDFENEFNLISVERVRVFKIENSKLVVKLYEKKPVVNKNEEEWGQIEIAQGVMDAYPKIRGANMNFIPFVFIGSKSCNPIPPNPPLLDLINLNIKHWQVSVDYYHGLHYCAMPTPWAAGFPASSELYIGAMKAWVSESPDAKCGFLEFTGQGLDAISSALDKLERQMAIMGARMLEEQKKAAEAAETLQMRYSGDSATLSNIVVSVEQGITKAINMMCAWLKIDEDADVKLNRDFVAARLSAQEITALVGALQAGGISLDTFIYNLSVGELLPDDRTVEDEKTLIDEGANKAKPFGNNFIPGDKLLPFKGQGEAGSPQ